MTDKLRKYVLPNIPYVFIGWVFLKLGTAYRLAAGSDFAHKLLGLGQTIGAAFADFAPGLALFDWLVGIVGGGGVPPADLLQKQERKEVSPGCGVRQRPLGKRKGHQALCRSQV